MVNVLLERDDIDHNKLDRSGQALLQCSTQNGHGEVAKILLRRDDIDPDKPNVYSQVQLLCTTKNQC